MQFKQMAQLILLLLIFGAVPGSGQAASVIVMDPETLTYAFRFGEADINLKAAARTYCNGLGGTSCSRIVTCDGLGYGAIARDSKNRGLGGACGAKNQNLANAAAITACVKTGGKKNSCVVASRFSDSLSGTFIDQAQLRGHWAENCKVRTYAFSFVAPAMFEISNCRCKLFQNGKCQLRRCSTEKGLFGPGKRDGHYINPTFSQDITQLDKNRMRLRDPQWEKILHRCPQK